MKKLNAEEIIKLPFFFIIGRPRTGTTLLRSLMDAHRNVIIPLEGPIILQLYGKYHHITNWTKENLTDFYNDLMLENDLEFMTIENWNVDKEKLKNDLFSCEGKNSFANICKIVNGNFPSLVEKDPTMLGDKNPLYSNRVKYLLKLYPEAKFIIITRDYRDHIQSMHKVDFGQELSAVLAFRWRKFIRTNLKHKKRHPDRFYWVRYEDFAAEPKKHLKEISEFLNIPFDEKVLEFYKYKDAVSTTTYKELQEKYHQSLLHPITTKSVGDWKKTMREVDVKISDAMVGSYAKKAGYEKKYKKSGLGLKLKLFPVKIYLLVTDAIAEIFMQTISPQLNSKIVARGPRLLLKYWSIVHKNETINMNKQSLK